MNTPWLDPRLIDWQDALNPLARYQLARDRNRFAYEALQQPLTVALRNAPGYQLHLECVPDPEHATLAGSADYDQTVSLKPGSWVIGFSGSSEQAAGALVSLQSTTGARLWTQPIAIKDATGSPVHYLAKPLGFTEPAAFDVRITNLANVANLVQLIVWIIEPV